MSVRGRLISGAGVHYGGQLVILILGLWITPLVLMLLGITNYGLWLIGQQLLTYLGLVDFGVVALLPRDLGRLRGCGSNADDERRDLIRAAVWLSFAQGLGAALIGAVVWAHLPEAWVALRPALAITLAGSIVLAPSRVFVAVLQGEQDYSFVSGAQTLGWLTATGVSVALLVVGCGIESLAWGWLGGQTLSPVACWLRLRARFPAYRFALAIWPGRTCLGRQAREGFAVTLNQFGVTLLSAIDVFLIGYLIGPAAVVVYSCTGRLILVLGNQAQAAAQMALPTLAEIGAGGDGEQARRAASALTLTLLLVSGLVVSVLLLVNGTFIGWWVGPEYYAGQVLNGFLLAAMLVRHWNLAVIFSLFAFGYNYRLTLTVLADGLVTLGLSYLLVNGVGSVGVPLGALGGVALVSLPLNLFALRATVGVGWRSIAGWAVRFVPVAGAAAWAGAVLPVPALRDPHALFQLAAGVLGATCVYSLVMWPVIRQTPLGTAIGSAWGRVVGRKPVEVS